MTAPTPTALRRRSIQPFLRWPGGKRWLVPAIHALASGVPVVRYVEPFLGGGAVFLGIDWPRAHLSDINPSLIATWSSIGANASAVRAELACMEASPAEYVERRANPVEDLSAEAARFVYLNRCAYGGIYRTNLKGEFNVPFGGARGLARLQTSGELEAVSECLVGVQFSCAGYQTTLEQTGEGDFVYCDPTYALPDGDSFDRYVPGSFTWQDQLALAEMSRAAARRGAVVVVSNGSDPRIADLHSDAGTVELVRRSQLPKSRASAFAERLFVHTPNGDGQAFVDSRLSTFPLQSLERDD